MSMKTMNKKILRYGLSVAIALWFGFALAMSQIEQRSLTGWEAIYWVIFLAGFLFMVSIYETLQEKKQ